MGRLRREQLNQQTLQAVTVLRFLPYNIKNRINELCTFSVVSLGPVVPRPGLPENEVIRPENLPVWAGTNAIHRARFEIHEDCPRNIPAAACLIVVNVHSLKLKIGGSNITSGRINPVLITYHFPEFGPDLIPTLPSLNVKNFTHFGLLSG